jgi:Outer membrane protein beta-barrel family/Carboxypeptidase regulatory-like domain
MVSNLAFHPMRTTLLRLLFAVLLLSGTATLFAQNPGKINLRGTLTDTLNQDIPLATVMLLNPSDSSLLNFTRADDKGFFQFKNLKNRSYLLKVTYVGYLPLQMRLAPSAKEDVDLGRVMLKPISTELMEVVIRTAKAPLRIKGDTIEYDATTFKVPPGSTVEDLLRRLPGIEVDADGNIKAQGRDVNRVYVDGKVFFSDDPKSATKNLGAETLSRVQVYDEKSEQAQLTGVEDGKDQKVMNLELKDEYKKGSFGKITVAGGTEDRWATRGNYNRFNSKNQLSFIGFANNINETGVNWEDYGEFKGQNSFNGNNDNADFGFGGGMRWYWSGGDDITNNFDGRGFTRNFGGGTNWNFDDKKTKVNTSYFYNQTALDLDEFGLEQRFLPNNSSFTNTDTTANNDFRSNHSVATRVEHNIDSSNTLIVKGNLRFSHADNDRQILQQFDPFETTPARRLNLQNTDDLNSYRLTSLAIFRHRFQKKGRAFALSTTFNDSRSDANENLTSLNRFFAAETFEQQVRLLNTNTNNTRQYKSSVLYTDAFSGKWFWETFANASLTQNAVNRQSQNALINQRVDSLSVFYDNDVQYGRVGSGIRYSYAGLNVSVGLAGQGIRLQGAYARDEGQPAIGVPLDRTFTNLVPNFDVAWELPGNIWINTGYSYSATEPQFSDLQPVPNVTNPAFRIEGNPNLTPERSHSVSLNFNRWDPANFSSIGFGIWGNLYDNRIVQTQFIEVIDSVGVRTTTRPLNVDGGNQINGWLWSNFPLIKTKLTMNVNGNIDFSESPTFVNNIENINRNRGFGLRVGLNCTPMDRLILGVNGNANFNFVRYSIQESQNQNIQNHGADVYLKWQVASRLFLESNYDYSLYQNDRFDFDRRIPIWNASLRYLLGAKNRVELRLAAFDIFNKRVNINQFGSQNFVQRREAPTLARYFMLSASYNLRGYENKLDKNNWF